GLVIVTLLGQLVAVLYLRGAALSAQHQAAKLDTQIAQAEADIARTKQDLAVWNSAARIKKLARARGWRLAQPSDFDDVTKLMLPPLSPELAQAQRGDKTGRKARRRKPQVQVEMMPVDGGGVE
ncbi:MAG: hypothetical protein M3347_16170, partial [Armatimonadota bacterium]|nr:hypothetical protein [Armatimonadota bacterium]